MRIGVGGVLLGPEGEAMATQTVTVMFTDQVGSTAPLTCRGAHAADDVRGEHLARRVEDALLACGRFGR